MSIDCFARERQPVKHSPLPRQPRTLREIGSQSMPSAPQPSRNSRLRRPEHVLGRRARCRGTRRPRRSAARDPRRVVCRSAKRSHQRSSTKSGARLQMAEFTSEPPPRQIACIVGITVPTVARSPPSRMVRAIEIPPSTRYSAGVKGGPSSSSATRRPASVSSFATTAPPGPEPTTATSTVSCDVAVVVGEDAEIDVARAHRARLGVARQQRRVERERRRPATAASGRAAVTPDRRARRADRRDTRGRPRTRASRSRRARGAGARSTRGSRSSRACRARAGW